MTRKLEMPVIPFSVLDLAPINQGSDAVQAFRNSLDLAQHAERRNYKRFWLAEHHNMPGIASAATAVVIGYSAGGTSTIRVGSGGVMSPNHAPLVIAEQFGTLESLYRGRIDLGLGSGAGGARCRIAVIDMSARIEHVQCTARSDARFAVCVRVALCPFGADAGARCVSRPLSAVGTAFPALRAGWRYGLL